jgi:peptide/nickel transport system substrate-binding protein
MKRSIIVATLAALAILVLSTRATTTAAAPAPQAAAQHTLTIAMSGDIETLDSDFSHFTKSNEVNYNTQDQFFYYGWNTTPEGYLMYDPKVIKGGSIESWQVAPDGLSVTLNVRQGMKFNHTGNPVTADDFIYYFDRGIQTKSGYLWNINNANITKWEKTGQYQFKLYFSKPSPFFFFLFRDQSQAPVDSVEMKKHATADDPWSTKWKANHEAASGEYYVDSWDPGVQMVLKANPNYWMGKPYFDTVVLKVVPSDANRVLLLQQGAVDIARDLSPDELDQLRKAPGVQVLSVPTRDQYHMGLNNKMAPFDNKLVRQALSYAVPYDTIIKDVFKGQAVKSQSPVAVKGNGFVPGLWPYTYDLNKAKQLLAQAGKPNGFDFTLDIAAGDPVTEELAIVMQSTLKQIGVNMTINKQTDAIFAEGLDKTSHQAWLREILWYVDDAAYTGFAFYTCNNPINWMAYCNPKVDDVVYKAAAIWKPEDQATKNELTKQMQELIIDDAPTLMLGEIDLQLAMRDNITGYLQLPDNMLWYYMLQRKE